ncbi:MAG TPA: fdxN element excision recombinase XisF [Nostocaceae cyanobacterium]|nr:fdxN element excision recombinase XisF [Nostocaceae cyanobacterium]
MKRIVGYARVSTREQAVDSQALEQQKARLIAAGAQELFVDVESGRKNDRRALKQLMNLVNNQQVDEVIITRLDRKARSLVKLRECVDIYKESGVNLRVLDQQIDLNTSQGKLLVNVLGALAEWEVDMLSERVKHGKQHRRNQKLACESYPWPYQVVNGKYQLENRRFLCLIEERPDNYQELYDEQSLEKLPGLTTKQIALDCINFFFQEQGLSRTVKAIFRKYGIMKTKAKKNGADGILHWTPTGFKRWLTNPVLCGHTVYHKRVTNAKGKRKPNEPKNWQIERNTHPEHCLLTDEQALEIEQILKFSTKLGYRCFNSDPNQPGTYREFSYQKGLVFCPDCGHKCIPKSAKCRRKGEHHYYFACRYAGMGCGNLKSTRREKIEAALIQALVQRSAAIAQGSDQQQPVIPEKSEKLQKLEERLAALEKIPDFDPDLENLKAKTRQLITEELNPFSSDSLANKTSEELIVAGNNLAIWYSLSNDEKVPIYHKLVRRITIRNGGVESVILNV